MAKFRRMRNKQLTPWLWRDINGHVWRSQLNRKRWPWLAGYRRRMASAGWRMIGKTPGR